MDNRIDDALEAIQELEDSILDTIQYFEEETGFDNLITVAHPDAYTILISMPKDIAICTKCDGLYDTALGCCA